MARNLVDHTAVFLDDDLHVVPPARLSLLASLSPQSLESLACAAASELTGHSPLRRSTDNIVDQSSASHYDAYAAMCTIVASCARDGGRQTPTDQRYTLKLISRQQLYALGVHDNELQSKLTPVVAAVVPRMRRVLESINFDFGHVVDVAWRLDYVLRSSEAGSVQEPLYFVQLQVQSPRVQDAKLETVAFTCSVEELRVLVYRIQEAANEVEKLVAGVPSQLRTSV